MNWLRNITTVMGFLLVTAAANAADPPEAPSAALAAAPAAKAAKTATPSTAYLPMARKGEIASPKALADRIRESLKKGKTGNGRVLGANITPQGFLAAVKKAGGAVDGVQALPAYLDSLIERDMPSGTITMSRVVYTRDAKGTEKFVLDIDKGHPREAHRGEHGWYDANTGYLILAGDCSNSPLVPTKGPVEAPAAAASAPAAPASQPAAAAPVASAPASAAAPAVCDKPLQMNLIVWDAKALDVRAWEQGALGGSYSGRTVASEIEATKPDQNGYYKPSRVSRHFGSTFRAMHAKGELAKSSVGHKVTVTHYDIAGKATVLFDGVVKSEQLVPMPKDLKDDDIVKVYFPDFVPLASPVNGDLRGLGKEFVKSPCGAITNFHAIEAKKGFWQK